MRAFVRCALVTSLLLALARAQTIPVFTPDSRLPIAKQIRKTVAFLQLSCERDNQLLDVRGTGFFVDYPDERIGKNYFVYLVTNRHVAECWDDSTHRPLKDDIRSKIDAAHSVALPSSALSKACQYALTLWKKLTRFLEYPELELTTNLAENSMRPVALGRKNWIHIGSPRAGPKVATILSVVESCRRLKLPVRDYLAAVLPGLADRPIQCLPSLTPAAWVAQHS